MVEGARVATPTALRVTLAAGRQNPSWHLDHIVWTELPEEGGAAGRTLYFAADRWAARVA
jgi:hypothetical protein